MLTFYDSKNDQAKARLEASFAQRAGACDQVVRFLGLASII